MVLTQSNARLSPTTYHTIQLDAIRLLAGALAPSFSLRGEGLDGPNRDVISGTDRDFGASANKVCNAAGAKRHISQPPKTFGEVLSACRFSSPSLAYSWPDTALFLRFALILPSTITNMKSFTLPIFVGLVGLATARTDLSGCISSATTNQWHEASMIWYVPGSGEICSFVDCGGGRAPPKTDQPGCPLYSGTGTLTPSYLPGYGASSQMAATTTTTLSRTPASTHAHATTDSSSSPATNSNDSMVTAAPTTSPVVSMTTTTQSGLKSGNSTSAAPTSTQTGGAAAFPASNVAGVMAVLAAVVGAIAL